MVSRRQVLRTGGLSRYSRRDLCPFHPTSLVVHSCMYNLIYWMPSPRFRNYFTSRTWSLDYVGKVQNSKWFMFIGPCLLFHIRWFMFVGSCLLVHVRWTILGSSWVGLGVSCLWSHAAVVLWIRLVELGIDSSILSRIVRSSRFRATVCVCVCVCMHVCLPGCPPLQVQCQALFMEWVWSRLLHSPSL